MSEPTTPEPLTAAPPSADVDAALLAIERAEKAVDDLCQGRLRWEMRVPAEPDHDPDLIISDALRLARAAIRAEAVPLDVERLTTAMDNVMDEYERNPGFRGMHVQAAAVAAEYDRLAGAER